MSMGEVLSREVAGGARSRPIGAGAARSRSPTACFDLLHVGHVRYLEAAAAEADVWSWRSTTTPRCGR